jgi:DNA-binding Xre family transcriptional regulator
MTITNRFMLLLAQKGMRENRIISIAEVAREIQVDQRTLGKWAKNTITRYDTPVIDALCKYFKCSPGDLIIQEPV